MTLPSSTGGATTEEVGYFEVGARRLADWIVLGFDPGWVAREGAVTSMTEAVALLRPGTALTRYLCVPVGAWTALLSNGPHGTDVGVLPSYAARELKCRAIRAVRVEDSATYPARILSVYGPRGAPPLALERSVVAANDGGRWVFETTGVPFAFEDLAAYAHPRKACRFTTSMLDDYLRELGVPIDVPPVWAAAVGVELAAG